MSGCWAATRWTGRSWSDSAVPGCRRAGAGGSYLANYIPANCDRRAAAWRVLLGLLPVKRSLWSEVCRERRGLYRQLVTEMIIAKPEEAGGREEETRCGWFPLCNVCETVPQGGSPAKLQPGQPVAILLQRQRGAVVVQLFTVQPPQYRCAGAATDRQGREAALPGPHLLPAAQPAPQHPGRPSQTAVPPTQDCPARWWAGRAGAGRDRRGSTPGSTRLSWSVR